MGTDYPHRFARPEVMNQIAVVNQGGKGSAERVIVLPARSPHSKDVSLILLNLE
jgi:hypothetical protein